MKTTHNLRRSSASAVETFTNPLPPKLALDKLRHSVQLATQQTTGWLLAQQADDGYWCGELQGDTILESEYILLLAWLGREDSSVAHQAAAYIVEQQMPSGGWAQYPGGEVDISGSVKAYFALKLTGHDPKAEYMQRACRAIIAHGGADSVNSFTRFYLALLGQVSFDHCPAVPPEAVLLPAWFPLSIYRISAWSRTILVPLSIIWALRPLRRITRDQGIPELFIQQPDQWPALRCPGLPTSSRWLAWERVFRVMDQLLKRLERWRIRPWRRRALDAAAKWMTERFEGSDGLGAIFPPIVWSLIALKCLGYDDDSVQVGYCHQQLDDLMIQEQGTIRLQPCESPVWDTALALRALTSQCTPSQRNALQRAASWLLGKEVRCYGDWAKNVRAEPSGWFFEHNNPFYPDIDDTAMVMMALRELIDERKEDVQRWRRGEGEGGGHSKGESYEARVSISEEKVTSIDEARRLLPTLSASPRPLLTSSPPRSVTPSRIAAACERARRWILAMQNRDGGWGAFDKDNNNEFLCHVPFADHNAMIDPSTPDITGRVVESLAYWGMTVGDPRVDRAIAYLRSTQEPDGSWLGRWGVNYIYGTWQVLVGLTQAGVSPNDVAVRRGAEWLVSCQQRCGGWGESADTYIFPVLRGQGPTTASQTAWALLGLMAAEMQNHPAVERGIRYLVESQCNNGTWDEEQFTGTGFPRVFYLRYHYYCIYFPLLALGKWMRADSADGAVAKVRNDDSLKACGPAVRRPSRD